MHTSIVKLITQTKTKSSELRNPREMWRQSFFATLFRKIHEFDYDNLANKVCDPELGIGTATQLLLIEKSNELEGRAKE